MNNKNVFSLFYDTVSTDDHTIDASVLGKSLISISESIEFADKFINGEDSEVKIKVVASHEGSFGVEFEVVQILQTAKDILKIIGITAGAGAASAGTVLGIIEALKSRKVVATIDNDQGNSTIELDDGSFVECTSEVKKLVTNSVFRSKIEPAFVNPLTSEPGSKIKFVDQNQNVLQEIESERLTHFKKTSKQTIVEETFEDKEVELRFTQVNFESKNGWRVDYLNENLGVRMNDEGFLARISERKENFVKGDLFKVILRKSTKIESGKTPSEKLSIEKVVRHRVNKERKIL